jgi:hypothetical protein
MSTKSTIVSGPTFHLYNDLADEDSVYLELEGVGFEASYNRAGGGGRAACAQRWRRPPCGDYRG